MTPPKDTPREHKVQLSIKRGNDMLNVRADNANEFKALLDELSELPEIQAFFPPKGSTPTPAAGGVGPGPAAAVESSAVTAADILGDRVERADGSEGDGPAEKADPLTLARERAKARMKKEV